LAILQSLNDTFRKASSQFEERLDNAIRATKAAIAATLEHRRARTSEVEPEVARLAALRAALLGSRDEISLAAGRSGNSNASENGSLPQSLLARRHHI
jgi:hypothetical protein